MPRQTIEQRDVVVVKDLTEITTQSSAMVCEKCGGEPTVYHDMDYISQDADSYFLVCEVCKIWVDAYND